MDNISGFIAAEMIAIPDIAAIVINLQQSRANIQLSSGFTPVKIPYQGTELTGKFTPAIQNGLQTVDHSVSVRIPHYKITDELNNYLNNFKVNGGVLLLSDTDNKVWVSGSLDAPLTLEYENRIGDDQTSFRGYVLNFNAVLTHSILYYYPLQ